MIENKDIAHFFPATGPHLCKTIAPFCVAQFPSSKVYMWSSSPCGKNGDKVSIANKKWIDSLPKGAFGGYIESTPLIRGGASRFRRRLATVIAALFVPKFSLKSWLKVYSGPDVWIFHGGLPLSIPTMLMFRLLGKKVVAIHWGLPLGKIPWVQWSYNWSCRLMHHVFVLMTPEEEFFNKYVKTRGVSTLSYPGEGTIKVLEEYKASEIKIARRVMILGNSTYNRDAYIQILDKTPTGSWDKIICMLNYGREDEKVQTDAFVKKYRAKFGESFFAWRETVAISEYLKIMGEADFYIGPAQFQSGLGAIFRCMAQNKTVVIRGHNYKWLRELGTEVIDVDSLSDYSYETLYKVMPSAEARNANRERLHDFFARINTPEHWADEIRRHIG